MRLARRLKDVLNPRAEHPLIAASSAPQPYFSQVAR